MKIEDFLPIEYMHRDGLIRVRRRSLDWIAYSRKSTRHRWLQVRLPRVYVDPHDAMVGALIALGLVEEGPEEELPERREDLEW
jgi:hypothetical protein